MWVLWSTLLLIETESRPMVERNEYWLRMSSLYHIAVTITTREEAKIGAIQAQTSKIKSSICDILQMLLAFYWLPEILQINTCWNHFGVQTVSSVRITISQSYEIQLNSLFGFYWTRTSMGRRLFYYKLTYMKSSINNLPNTVLFLDTASAEATDVQ